MTIIPARGPKMMGSCFPLLFKCMLGGEAVFPSPILQYRGLQVGCQVANAEYSCDRPIR